MPSQLAVNEVLQQLDAATEQKERSLKPKPRRRPKFGYGKRSYETRAAMSATHRVNKEQYPEAWQELYETYLRLLPHIDEFLALKKRYPGPEPTFGTAGRFNAKKTAEEEADESFEPETARMRQADRTRQSRALVEETPESMRETIARLEQRIESNNRRSARPATATRQVFAVPADDPFLNA